MKPARADKSGTSRRLALILNKRKGKNERQETQLPRAELSFFLEWNKDDTIILPPAYAVKLSRSLAAAHIMYLYLIKDTYEVT